MPRREPSAPPCVTAGASDVCARDLDAVVSARNAATPKCKKRAFMLFTVNDVAFTDIDGSSFAGVTWTSCWHASSFLKNSRFPARKFPAHLVRLTSLPACNNSYLSSGSFLLIGLIDLSCLILLLYMAESRAARSGWSFRVFRVGRAIIMTRSAMTMLDPVQSPEMPVRVVPEIVQIRPVVVGDGKSG